jgi:hypothetical protein
VISSVIIDTTSRVEVERVEVERVEVERLRSKISKVESEVV